MTAITPPAPKPITREQHELLAAWLIVIQRVGQSDVRLLTILAMPSFGTYGCVRCLTCADLPSFGHVPAQLLSITEVARHLRLSIRGSHALALNETAFVVTP